MNAVGIDVSSRKSTVAVLRPVTIYLPLDLWQPAIGMGHLVA